MDVAGSYKPSYIAPHPPKIILVYLTSFTHKQCAVMFSQFPIPKFSN